MQLCRRQLLIGIGGFLIVPTSTNAAQRRTLPSVAQIRARGEHVWRIVDEINAYRRTARLPAIPLSPRMTAVAAAHAKDLAEKKPHDTHGSMHSWSQSARWTGGAFRASDPKTHAVMWNKPREIAAYDGDGFEIAASGVRDPGHAVTVWKGSAPHNEVVLNRGIWARYQWKALGAVLHEGFACAWFGAEEDA